MKEKEVFVEPEMEILTFEVQDVVKTSNGSSGGIVLPDDPW